MEVKKLTLGPLASNCYIIEKNNQVLIVDPGDMPDVIFKNINKDAKVLAVLLTHGHFDHIGALDAVVAKYDCPVFISINEKELIYNSRLSFYDKKIESELTFIDDDLRVSDFKIKLHKTPGHTAGSVMFEIEEYLFTGDTLFDQSIGRVDFPTGSQTQMLESLNYIKGLNLNLIICPGHGEISNLKKQIFSNPFLNR